MTDEGFQKARDYTFKLLSFRPRSTREVRQKLKIYLNKKNLSEDLLEKVISDFTRQNFLNDLNFAKWWTDQRSRASIKGSKLIFLELSSKGIDKEIINEVLNSQNQDVEIQKSKKILEKKINLFSKKYPKQILKFKLNRYLLGKGFSFDIVKKAIDEVISKS